MVLNPDKGIALFTDGSYNYQNDSGGWAWAAIDCHDGLEVDCGYVDDVANTNNRMEMQAWIEGLNYLIRTFGPCDVLVYSDSQYVGLGAMDRTRARKKNGDLWTEIDEVIDSHRSVEFVWVKGHHESCYNQLVDELAGQARKVGNNG
jgi:ribonuclease HI